MPNNKTDKPQIIHILFIDNNDESLCDLLKQSKEYNYKITKAKDENAATRQIFKHNFELIVLNLPLHQTILPQILNKHNKKDCLPAPHVILCGVNDSITIPIQNNYRGTIDYLQLPIKSDELISKINLQASFITLNRKIKANEEELKSASKEISKLKNQLHNREASSVKDTQREPASIPKQDEYYRSLFIHTNEGFCFNEIILDKNGKPVDFRFLEINPAFESITGIKHDNVIGKKVTEIIPGIENDPADWIGKFGRVALTEKSSSFEGFSRAMGRWFQVHCFSPEKGTFATTFTDITERKKTEEALKLNEEQSKAITQTATDAIVTINATGKVLTWNQGAEKIFGYTSKEIINKDLLQIIPQQFKKSHKTGLERLISYGKEKLIGKTIEISAINKDKTEFPVELSLSSWTSNDKKYYTAIIRDISRRKTAEERLKQSELLLSETGKMGKIGGWELNAESFEISWTEEVFRIFEVPIGPPPSLEEVLSFYHPDDLPWFQKKIEKALTEGTPYDVEIRFITKKGKHLWMRTICNPVLKEDKVLKLVGTFQDITARKSAEEELKNHKDNLEQLIKERTHNLQESNNKLNILFKNMPLGFAEHEVIYDTEGQALDYRFLYTNEAFKKLTGIKANVVGKTVSMLMPDSYKIWVEKYADVAKNGHTKVFEQYEKSFDKYYRISAFSSQKGNFATLFEDISDRKKQQAYIEKSEERFKISTENVGIATWEWDIKNDATSGSSFYKELFGFEPQQSNAAEIWKERMHPDDLQATLQILQDHLSGKTESYYAEFRYKHPEKKEYIWILGSGKVTEYFDDGSPKTMMGINQDITRQKKQSKHLKKSQQRLKIATENLGLATWEWDIKNDVIYCSEMYKKLLGFDPQEENANEVWQKAIHPEDLEDAEKQLYDHLNGASNIYHSEFRYRRSPDQDYFWMLGRGKVTEWDEEGLPKIMMGINQDITERKNAENLILQKEVNFRNLFEQSLDAIFILDPKTKKCLECNNTAAQIFSFPSKEDAIGLSPIDAAPEVQPNGETSLDVLDREFKKIREEGIAKFEFTHQKPNGELFICDIVLGQITYNNKKVIQAIAQDITARKKTEEEIRNSKRLLETFLNSIDGVVYVKDKKGIYKLINRAFEERTGINKQNIIGKDDYALFGEEIAQRLRINDLSVIQKKQAIVFEETVQHNNNKLVYLSNKVPLLNNIGEIDGVCGVSIDITEHIKHQEALAESEKNLAEAQRMAHLGNWNWNLKTGKIIWSDEVYRLFGYQPNDIEPSYDLFINAVHPEDRNNVNQAVSDAHQSKSVYNIEHRIILPDDTIRFMHGSGEVLFNNKQEPVEMVGTILDITERKTYEKSLHNRTLELERFNKAMIGREKRIIKLKQEVNELCKKLGQDVIYKRSIKE